MSAAPVEKPSTPVASFAFMTASVVGLVTFLVYSLLARRRYEKVYGELGMKDLPLPTEFFLHCPIPIYLALGALLVVATLVKEVAVEDKTFTLKLNIATAAGVLVLWGAWTLTVRGPLYKIQQHFQDNP